MSRRKLEFPSEAPIIPAGELHELIEFHTKADGPYSERTAKALTALAVTQMIVRREPPKGRPRSLTLSFAISIMHQLLSQYEATQKEAARAVLSGPKADALLRAYGNAKRAGELKGVGVVGPWADSAAARLNLALLKKGKKGTRSE